MAKVWKKLQRADGDFQGTWDGVAKSNVYHTANKPTKSDVGLSNVENFSKASILSGTFTGDIDGTSAADIKAKAIAGEAAKNAVDGNANISMVGGSIYLGTMLNNGKYPFSVNSSGDLKINEDEFQALSDGTVNCKGTFTIKQDSSGDSKIVLEGDSTGTSLGVDTDGDFEINNTEAKEIRLYTSDTQRLTIQSGGNVGIGTSSPSTKLDVNGTTRIGNGSDGIELKTTTGLASIIGVDTGYNGWNDLELRAGSATQLHLDTSGNVGIGTASPSQKLDVDGHINVNGSIIGSHSSWLDIYTDTSNGSDTKATRIGGGGDVSSGRGAFATFYGTDHGSKPGDLYLTPGGGDCIINSGNVGIGTDTPSTGLHVYSSDANQVRVERSTGGNTAIHYKNTSDDWYAGITSQQDFSISQNADIASGSEFRIQDSTGNVGIGTSSPDAFCDIVGSAGSKYALRAVNSSSQGWGAYIKGGADSADTSLHVVDKDSDSLFFVRGDGKVSIGAGTSPSQKLHVDGVGQFDSGVKLNSSSTTLDDYEEGSWTPTMNSSWTHSGTSTNNRYTKIGNVVTLWGHLSNVSSGTSSGNITITSLPFSVSHSAAGGTAMLNYVNFNSKTSNVSPFVNTSEELYFYETAPGYAWAKMGNADLSSGDDIYFQITYETSE